MTFPKSSLFYLIALSIPLLFFALLEVSLVLFGYGQSLPLFIDVPDSKNYILARPDIIRRYFPASGNIPSVTMEANLFLKHKPENGLRIFVQGGSTAAGFPYGLGASPAGFLDQRLKQVFPNRTVEVINTAMSAVNSYTLLDFVDEIIAQKPDAILIYAGHNEFLGILGVGSNYSANHSSTANLLLLKLHDFRTFQLIQNIYHLLTSTTDSSEVDANKRTFMAKVAKEKNIAIDSEIYQLGLEQFRTNLDLLLARYKKAGIPVLISTIASNLRDQQPFVSDPIDDNDLEIITLLATKSTAGKLNPTDLTQLAQLSQSATQQNNSALHFKLAKIFEQIKQYTIAKKHFTLAKDDDLLRFRAPSAINRIIREAAKLHAAVIVDFENDLYRRSFHGLIGNNFILEHLHPNLQGYFILADNFYQALKKEKTIGKWVRDVPTNIAWRQRPIIPAEEYNAFANIIQLKADYPFSKTPKKISLPSPKDWQQQLGLQYFRKKIDWLTMMNLSYQGYLKNRNIPMLMKTAQIIADSMPQNAKANYRVGQQLVQAEKPKQALIYYNRALREDPDNKLYISAVNRVLDIQPDA